MRFQITEDRRMFSARARVSSTTWVRGKTQARILAQKGSCSKGKKVPEKRNIGVTKRKTGG